MTKEDVDALRACEPVRLELDGIGALFVFSVLQLGLAHPDVHGMEPAKFADGLARHIQGRISVTPNLAAICEAGWDRTQDVPVEVSRIIIP